MWFAEAFANGFVLEKRTQFEGVLVVLDAFMGAFLPDVRGAPRAL